MALASPHSPAEQLVSARRGRGATERITDFARDLIPAGTVNGMGGMSGHIPMQAFYGQGGMRQSAPGNPHAPVVIPSRPRAVAPPPPGPAPQSAPSGGGAAEYENYSDDNVMGGQAF